MVKTVLILDTQTTGLTPLLGKCIEIGAILFDVPSRAVISQLSFLVPCTEPNPVQHINNIPSQLTTLQPSLLRPSLELFKNYVDLADLVVAHNVDFDRQWFGIDPLPQINKPWLCTMSDFSWPGTKTRPSVTAVALAHGIPVWAAHRALTDCIYLAQIFERCPDLQASIENAASPRTLYQALVSFDDRQLAKDAGFAWNTDGLKRWTRKLTKPEAEALPFKTKPVALPFKTKPVS